MVDLLQILFYSKTSGAACVFFNQTQALLIQAYIAIVTKYCEQNPQYTYPVNGPLFVNQRLRQFLNKQSLDWSVMAEITKKSNFGNHDCRRMFSTYIGCAKSLIIRQAGALAACHR